jgi:hypothetical protein
MVKHSRVRDVLPALNMVGDAWVKNFWLMRLYVSITRSMFDCKTRTLK